MQLHRLVPAAALITFAGFAFASATPNDVSIGTEVAFTAPGETDLGTKKPKVKAIFVSQIPAAKGDPKLKLKVSNSTPTSFNAIVKKAKGSGVFDIQVTPKGGDPFIIDQLITQPPSPDSTSSDTVAPKGALTINGVYFGSKKPKVFINGKKAKTKGFSDTHIDVIAHKKTPAGEADIVVQTKIGQGTLPDAVTVGEPDGGGGGNRCINDLRGSSSGDYRARLRIVDQALSGNWNGANGFSVSGSQTTRGTVEDIEWDIAFDLDTLVGTPTHSVDPTSNESFSFRLGGDSDRTFTVSTSGPQTRADITIESWDPATRCVSGTFDADLRDADSGETISIDGEFEVQLTDNRP